MKIVNTIECKTRDKYGFISHMQLLIFRNVLLVLSNTDSSCYFSRPNNLAFHNFIKGKAMSPKAKEVLGLSRKFIRTKKRTAVAGSGQASLQGFRALNILFKAKRAEPNLMPFLKKDSNMAQKTQKLDHCQHRQESWARCCET